MVKQTGDKNDELVFSKIWRAAMSPDNGMLLLVARGRDENINIDRNIDTAV